MPIASFGCHEEQQRGSLHLHVVYWGGLAPHVLQVAALSPVLISAVAKSIDMIVKAEVTSDIHVEHLLNKIRKIKQPKPALTVPNHPLRQPSLFKNDAQWAAVCCNVHQHSSTCYSGKIGKVQCRMALPKETVEQTGCYQIKPCHRTETHPEGINIIFKIK